jgi:hypothetical protein
MESGSLLWQENLERGDVVLLKEPKRGAVHLVKRVVAVEGDTITPLTSRS